MLEHSYLSIKCKVRIDPKGYLANLLCTDICTQQALVFSSLIKKQKQEWQAAHTAAHRQNLIWHGNTHRSSSHNSFLFTQSSLAFPKNFRDSFCVTVPAAKMMEVAAGHIRVTNKVYLCKLYSGNARIICMSQEKYVNWE